MRWTSLYTYCDDPSQVVASLQATLQNTGYTCFDPFDGVPGQSFPHIIRLFVGPPQAGWVRVLTEQATSHDTINTIAHAVSHIGLCLQLCLDSDSAQLDVFHNGALQPDYNQLECHLNAGHTLDRLRERLRDDFVFDTETPVQSSDMPWLPDDVQQMADNLNPKQVDKLFNKFMNKITNRLGDNVTAAEGLLKGQQIDWYSRGARQAVAIMACLTVEAWNRPDFVPLRDAYQLQRRVQRKPNAHLFPGEAEAMAAVPDALDYQPVYGGKSD